MEAQLDTLKVYRHHHHSRVQKEGEDMWISSEDLRTEGSSDEEVQNRGRGCKPKKNRKQKKSTLLDASKSASSLASTSSHSVESPAKDYGGEVEKSTVESNIDMSSDERFHVLSAPFFTDIFPDSAVSTSGISLGSSDSGMDALNLESRWRPKRGSLKYPILVEGQTTANYLHEIDGFFGEMMSKVKSLRTCPDLEKLELEVIEAFEEPKLFKDLKETPAVKEKLKYIEQLDEEIKETIEVYKAERAERLQVQKEMCYEICRNSICPEKETRLFLEMCDFEVSGNINNDDIKNSKEKSESNNREQKNRTVADTFIKRNIELAGQGSMASCSLTDEEKKKLEELLADDRDESYVLEDDPRTKDSGLSLAESDESSEEDYFVSNAYTLNEEDKRQLEGINSELEKFALDETEKEKGSLEDSQGQTMWKDTLLMEQRLKAINAMLDELHGDYETRQLCTGKSSDAIDGDDSSIESSDESNEEDTNTAADSARSQTKEQV